MRQHVKTGTRTKKSEKGERGEACLVLAPLFARSLISRCSILDDLLGEKRRLLAVYETPLFKIEVFRTRRLYTGPVGRGCKI